jgi:hypothetical protein
MLEFFISLLGARTTFWRAPRQARIAAGRTLLNQASFPAASFLFLPRACARFLNRKMIQNILKQQGDGFSYNVRPA